MTKRKKQPIHISVKYLPKWRSVTVMRRNSPIWTYHKSVESLNRDIRALKREIHNARLLKLQAYIAYRLTK